VKAGIEFLEGQTDELCAELEAEMKKASVALEFEKAAQLRDALEDLRRTTLKTEKFERIPYKLPVAINPESDLRELGRVLGLPGPPARIEGYDISNISGTFMVASMVSFWHGRPDRSNYRRFRMKTVTEQNDFACMAETIRRRYSRLVREIREGRPAARDDAGEGGEASPTELAGAVRDVSRAFKGKPPGPLTDAAAPVVEELNAPWVPRPPSRPGLPDLILIDGGPGQLNSACAELALLGLSHIPVIGLAKENEEIYRPGVSEPLVLGLDNNAVKLLQRVRDESHRFANTYNAQLRLRKISESVLDEFSGIGDARKQALLRKFGSVQRLRRASVEEIATIPGFGGRTAADLKAFLDARVEQQTAPDGR
jgi:excinuclease ABC subunit C